VDEADVRVLRALSLSGDWRERDGALELAGALAVNGPGFPINRPQLVRASRGDAAITVPSPSVRVRTVNAQPTTLIAAGIVSHCPECAKRAAAARQGDATGARLDRMEQMLTTIERRTRHLNLDAAEALRSSIAG